MFSHRHLSCRVAAFRLGQQRRIHCLGCGSRERNDSKTENDQVSIHPDLDFAISFHLSALPLSRSLSRSTAARGKKCGSSDVLTS